MLRLHYALHAAPLARAGDKAARGKIVAMYDERFFRMWEFYLAGGDRDVRERRGAAITRCNISATAARFRSRATIWLEAERRYREIAASRRRAKKPRAPARKKRSSLRALELGDQGRRRVDLLQRFLDRVGRHDDRPVSDPS